MSRLIVKNLPTYVTPARLREHFEQKNGPGGTLTDFKVASKPDGTSRRFGFVGYKTDAEAAAAQQWFHKTFIDSTRITVDIVEGAKDAPAPRPNKRPRLGPAPSDASTSTPMPPPSATTTAPPSAKSSAQRDKYLELMAPGKKAPIWANDAVTAEPDYTVTDIAKPSAAVLTAVEDDVVMEVAPDPNVDAISDLEWMKNRVSSAVDVVEKVFEQDDDDGGRKPSAITPKDVAVAAQPATPIDPVKQTILQTSRLFVRNLAFSCTDADLEALFKPFGDITQVHIPLDSLTKNPKGVAYITFVLPASALAAYEALDRRSFQGRLIHILAAVDRRGKIDDDDAEGRKKSVKDDKASKRRATAGREFNWSMLYMNSDAVASSIADRMSISKADILNPESDNAAVKLALAETHVIQETKTYLESQGVLLASFSSRVRSDTTILVKNIPYGTTVEQITELFEPHGQLNRVLVPPAGTMAVVEFVHADEAAKGFRAVAYRRLGNSVIYLEKAPSGMFSEDHVPTGDGSASYANAIKISEQGDADADGGEADEAEEVSVTGGSTLFVKNLAFATTTERLVQTFRGLPSFSFARVQMKPDPKRPAIPGSGVEAGKLSMGYGFVGFTDVEGARKAMKSMQGYVLDGHALHVKFAGRGAEEDVGKDKSSGKSKGTTTKMIVKNVPFEATKKDIRELFGSHGHLKSVRLPKKFDSKTRGFAFLDFVTRHEAENAYSALKHTHLLGRHLVLEWAEEAEQDLDVLRQKAGVGYGGGKEMPGKKRKINLGGDEVDGGEDGVM